MTSTARPALPTSSGRAVLALLAALVIALVGALPAAAHAQLVRSSPSSGATLSAVPPEVVLTFNEQINSNFATITVTSGGTEVTQGKAAVQGSSVTATIDPSMAEGRYTVAYKVTSADGHPVSGSYAFTYAVSGTGEGDPDAGSTSGGTSSPSAKPSSTSASSTSSSSAAASSTSSEPSSSSTSSTTTSTSSTTEPTASSTSTTPAASPTGSTPASTDGTKGDGGPPWWVWLLLVLGGGALIGALVARGRQAREQAEHDGHLGDEDQHGDPRDDLR